MRDVGNGVLLGEATASPHDTFCYHRGNHLEAVRAGRWKLHLARAGQPVEELYDLVADVGERANVFADHPDVVAELTLHAERARADLGDARLGVTGSGVRPVGEVANPVPLTTYDPHHPYYAAE